jgi:hypothetical protein
VGNADFALIGMRLLHSKMLEKLGNLGSRINVE